MASKINLLKEFNPSLSYPLYLIRNRLLNGLLQLVPRLHGKVLDFGCGIKPYQSLFNVTEYVGVDYAGEGETYSKHKVDFLYDGHTLPFSNESFDGIFSTEVAEHIFNLDPIIKELHRVLKTNGTILLTCPFSMPEHESPNDFARYTSFAIRDMLEKNGFQILEQLKTGNFVEAVFQMWIIYIDQSILYAFRKIPVLRSVLRVSIYGILNLSALLWSRVLPTNKNLYLNNIILAKKN
jgi:SAM-dependent methyltransferase